MCVFYLLPHEIIKYCSQLGARREKRVEGSSECGSSCAARALASCCKCEKSKVALGQCKRTVIPIYSARGPSFWYHACEQAWRGIKNTAEHSLFSRGAPLNWVHPRYILKPEVALMHVVKTTASFFSSKWHIASFMHQKCAPWLTFPPFLRKESDVHVLRRMRWCTPRSVRKGAVQTDGNLLEGRFSYTI